MCSFLTAIAGWYYRTANTIGPTFFEERLSGSSVPEAKDTFHLTGTLSQCETSVTLYLIIGLANG